MSAIALIASEFGKEAALSAMNAADEAIKGVHGPAQQTRWEQATDNELKRLRSLRDQPPTKES